MDSSFNGTDDTSASNDSTYGNGSSNGSSIGLVFLIVALIIVLVIVITIDLMYWFRRDSCYTNPSPWCYPDWNCPENPVGEQNIWDNLRNNGFVTSTPEAAKCYLGANNNNNQNPTKCDQDNRDGHPCCPNQWPFLKRADGISPGAGTTQTLVDSTVLQ